MRQKIMDLNMNRRVGLHYGSISLFTTILHNVFLLYHIEVFVSIYKIDKFSFWIGEALFLVWNSCNDPLFGWISDQKYLSKTNSYDQQNVVLQRLRALSWNGPLFALSFLSFWVAWTYPWLQFVICLCAYDGFLTMIDLHHSALLADLSVSADVRTQLNMYCSLFSAVGSLSVFLSYAVWHRDSLERFQLFCVALACFAFVGYLVSSKTLQTIYKKSDVQNMPNDDKTEVEENKAALKKFIFELAGHKNFVLFTAMNLVQVFHCHFNSNFFPLFLEILLGDNVSPFVCSLLLGVSFVAPHVNNLYFLTLCRRYGAYYVIHLLFWIKLLMSCSMFMIGPNHLWILALFIASNRVFTEGTCKLLNLVISDLVDEDVVLHHRHQAVSALMFGTVAFLSKPGQTLAPLFGTLLLSIYTGHDVFQTSSETGSIKMNISDMSQDARAGYQIGVFHLLVFIPILCALLQLLAWNKFTLHGKRLLSMKSLRNGFKFANV